MLIGKDPMQIVMINPRITSGQTMFTAQFVARSEEYYPSELSSGKLLDITHVFSLGAVSASCTISVLHRLFWKRIVLLAFDSKREDQKLVHLSLDEMSPSMRPK